jgi:hypothetical protein
MFASGCAEALTRVEPFREVTCSQFAIVSLKDAVETAEKRGGTAVDSHFHQSEELGCLVGQPAYYEVTLLSEGKLSFVSVHARSNEIVSYRSQRTIRERIGQFFGTILEHDPETKASLFRSVSVSLPDAIAIAERSGGKAIKAHVARKGAKVGYTVKLVEHSKLRVAWVDGQHRPINGDAASAPASPGGSKAPYWRLE